MSKKITLKEAREMSFRIVNEAEERRMCYMSLVGCFWLKVHQDLRPCRGCDDEHLQYITEEELDKDKFELI